MGRHQESANPGRVRSGNCMWTRWTQWHCHCSAWPRTTADQHRATGPYISGPMCCVGRYLGKHVHTYILLGTYLRKRPHQTTRRTDEQTTTTTTTPTHCHFNQSHNTDTAYLTGGLRPQTGPRPRLCRSAPPWYIHAPFTRHQSRTVPYRLA